MYDWSALRHGARAAIGVAGLVMAASFLGFGALVRGLEVGLVPGLLSTVLIWALPGQVVALDMLSRGAGLVAIALAVTLTAVRLMPMVVLVITKVHVAHARRLPLYVFSHFVAVTVWRICEDEIEQVERSQRLPWIAGLGMTLMACMLVMTTVGYHLAESLPPLLAACLVFLTPTFFFLSLFASARYRMDYLAIAAGVAIGPLCHLYYPELDLVAAGLGGGTLAYLATRWAKVR